MKLKIRVIKILILIIVIVTASFTYYYSRFLAPEDFKVSQETITNDTLPAEFDNFKIGFISDLNLQDNDDLTRLENIVTTINQQDIDMIIFGGDLFSSNVFESEQVINILTSINSRYGKFAVLGEKDLAFANETISVLNEGGFEVLRNECRTIYYNNAAISLFGLESNGDLSGLINESNQDSYKIVAVHEPDYFTTSSNSHIALQLSGHTMGGYIYLPVIGGIFKKTNGTTYVNGRHEINDSTLIISNGLSMESGYNYRLFCPNQINVIKLKK